LPNFVDGPVSRRATFVLPYDQNYTLTVGSTSTFGTGQVFRLNSCYDPDETGTGHQPYGWDQITPFYGTYKVTKCDVDLQFSFPSAAGVVCGVNVVIAGDTYDISGKSISAISEQPMSSVSRVPTTGNQTFRFRRSFPMGSVYGITEAQFRNSLLSFASLTTTNPTVIPRIQTAIASLNSSDSTATVYVQARLVYHVEMYQRVVLSQS
jgi:hypothetical protein